MITGQLRMRIKMRMTCSQRSQQVWSPRPEGKPPCPAELDPAMKSGIRSMLVIIEGEGIHHESCQHLRVVRDCRGFPELFLMTWLGPEGGYGIIKGSGRVSTNGLCYNHQNLGDNDRSWQQIDTTMITTNNDHGDDNEDCNTYDIYSFGRLVGQLVEPLFVV